MKLILTISVLLFMLWSTVAIPTPPHWREEDIYEIMKAGQDLSTENPRTYPTDVPPPPPEGCMTTNGSVPIGTLFYEGDCKHCNCIDDGKSICFTVKCPKIECADAVFIKGKCCAICPDGPNCRMDNGSILKMGDHAQFGDNICECVKINDIQPAPVMRCIYVPK